MDKRKQKTREAIQNAYIALLTVQPAPKLTVTALAKQANIDRKTFYLHYDTLEDVMHDYIRQVIRRLVERLETQHFFQGAFDAACFYRTLGQIVGENLALFQHIAVLPNMGTFWEEAKRMLTDSIMERYRDKVLVRPEVLRVYICFLLAGMQEIYRQWLLGELRLSLEEAGRIVSDAAFEGFSSILK